VDSGFETSSHFVTHLTAYLGLFRELSSFRFLYVAKKDAYFRKAEERFRSIVMQPLECEVAAEVLRYFHVRAKWERHEYVVPVTEDLEFLRESHRRFHGERFEDLFTAWKAGRVTERELREEFSPQKSERRVFFSTFLVHTHGSPVDEVDRRHSGCANDTHHE
jgi:hypothetical protein